jgi:hypothetical protein
MTVAMSPERALRLFTGLERRIGRYVVIAETQTVADARQMLMEASSGTLTESDLRRLDHPYARRHGTAKKDPSIINVRSGRFKRSWSALNPRLRARRVTSRVRNRDPKARFMFGTELMLPRPIVQRVAKQIRPIRRYRLRRALWYAVTTTS